MTETETIQLAAGVSAVRDKRGEPRAHLKVRIEVSGFNRYGRYFSEKTSTVDVSDGGCRFDLRTEVDEKSVIAIRLIEIKYGRELNTRPWLFQINWLQAQPRGWTLGASKLQPGRVWCASASDSKIEPQCAGS